MTKKIFLRTVWLALICAATFLFSLLLFIVILEIDLPNIQSLQDIHFQQPLRVFTKDQQLIAEFGKIRRTPIDIAHIPPILINATLATEDKRFFSHPGVDVIGLARAALVLVFTGKKEEGGSTITMQVARNFFLTRKKTYIRKLKEILLALRIDQQLSKNKILELYLNKVFYGNRAYGVVEAAKIYYGKKLNELTLPQLAMLAGIPQAPSTLNPLVNQKAAKIRRNHVLLRMLQLNFIDQKTYADAIEAPIDAAYHELKINISANYVAEMVRQFMVNKFGHRAYTAGYNVTTTIASNLQEASNNSLIKYLLKYDVKHGYRGPYAKIDNIDFTNLQPIVKKLQALPKINNLQPGAVLHVNNNSASVLLKDFSLIKLNFAAVKWARSQTLQDNIEQLGPYPSQLTDVLADGDIIYITQETNNDWRLAQIPAVTGALIAVDAKTGAILALTGGFAFNLNKFNHVTQASRQTGSSIKPFIFSAALNKNYTLATLINDAPIVSENAGIDNIWRPNNDNGTFNGPTRLREALVHSRNLVFIRLLQDLGIDYVIDYLAHFGFDKNQLPNNLSLALGTANITPLNMAAAYAIFANGGYKINPYFIQEIRNTNNKIIFTAENITQNKDDNIISTNDLFKENKIISKQNAYLTTSALKDVTKYGTAKKALELGRNDIAGKTGTTNEKRDAWFCGYNNNIVAVTWMGFDHYQPLGEYAATFALPIWMDFMRIALADMPSANMLEPKNIVVIKINKTTGQLAYANDPNSMFEIFPKKLAPTTQTQKSTNIDTTANSDFAINNLY